MEKSVLCVYYSRTGNTNKAIEQLSTTIQCDVERIGEPKTRKGLFGIIRSGYESMAKKIVTIDELKYDPSQYDLVIIATPLWTGAISTPIRSYLHKYQGQLKNDVALIVTSSAQSSTKVVQQVKELTNLEPKGVLELKQKEYKHDRINQKVEQFVKELYK